MLPFIGSEYGSGRFPRILLIAESHYFPKERNVPGPDDWYRGNESSLKADESKWNYIHTRGVVGNSWGGKGSRLFATIEKQLLSSGFPTEHSAFRYLAFMNAFQRPALHKRSFKPSHVPGSADNAVSGRAVRHTIETIQPAFVCVLSTFAWSQLQSLFQIEGVRYGTTVHPLCAWWNRPSKQGVRGRDAFRQFIEQAVGTSR